MTEESSAKTTKCMTCGEKITGLVCPTCEAISSSSWKIIEGCKRRDRREWGKAILERIEVFRREKIFNAKQLAHYAASIGATQMRETASQIMAFGKVRGVKANYFAQAVRQAEVAGKEMVNATQDQQRKEEVA